MSTPVFHPSEAAEGMKFDLVSIFLHRFDQGRGCPTWCIQSSKPGSSRGFGNASNVALIHAMKASGESNSRPIIFACRYPKKKKSDGARSGEYRRYGTSWTGILAIVSITAVDLCIGELFG
jgi:hypothetical protein